MAKHHFSLLVEAQSGKGKSFLVSLLISHLRKLIPQKKILVVDVKSEYELPGFKAIVITPSNYRAVLKKLPELLNKYQYLVVRFYRIGLDDMRKLGGFFARIAFILKNIILVFDEAHIFAPKYKTPEYVKLVSVMGRTDGIDSIFVTQRPQQLDTDVRSQTSHKIVGGMVDDRDKNAVRSYLGKYSDALDELPPYHFLFKDESGKLYITSTVGWKAKHRG